MRVRIRSCNINYSSSMRVDGNIIDTFQATSYHTMLRIYDKNQLEQTRTQYKYLISIFRLFVNLPF